MEIEARPRGSVWRWSLLVSVVVLNNACLISSIMSLYTNRQTKSYEQVCVPNLVLSYGVLLLHAVQLGVPTWLGLSAPVIHILTYGLTQCWCREAADSWGGPVGHRVMAAAGLLLCAGGMVVCGFVPMQIVPFVFGVAGGFGSSLISAQIDAVVFETYDSRLRIVRGLCLTGQAVGQSLFPHIITALIDQYGYSYSYIVLGGVMLQTLPAIMLLKANPTIRPVSFSRYSDLSKTYAIYGNEVESEHYSNEMQLHDMGRKCWKSPADDNLHRQEVSRIDAGESYTTTTITPPNSPEDRRRNFFGIDLLPDIPEETEESEEDDDQNDDNRDIKGKDVNKDKKRFSAAIKRLSTIGDNFDDYIMKQSRRDSESECGESREYSELEVTYDTVSPITDFEREKIMKSFSFQCESVLARIRRSFWMPSYRMYRLRRKVQFSLYSINDTFIKPLTRSLSSWRFYPALLLRFSYISLLVISLVLLPMVASHVRPKISTTETNFLMSLHGFTWLCFLLSTPWLAETPNRNFKYVAVLGLLISTVACFVLAASDSHDLFSIGCVVAGLGFGAISSCWESAVQDFVGVRKWSKLHSTLETLSAVLLATFFVCVCVFTDLESDLQLCLFILGVILSFVTFIWTIIAALSIYNTKIKTYLLIRKR